MEKPMYDMGLNITKNIKTIEVIKSRLLSEVALLHENMLKTNQDKEEHLDVFSEIIILSYILSNKLGIDYSNIDEKIIKKLKAAVLQEDSSNHTDISALLKHIDKNKL